MSINREENIKDFIEKLSPDKLNKILFTSKNLLQGKSVEPLIELMKLCDVAKLYNIESKWSLSIDGNFQNKNNQGNIKEHASGLGIVFKGQNEFINPKYINFNPYINNSSIEDKTMSIKSVDGFIKKIGSIIDDRGKNKIIWYRGMSNSEYELLPSLYVKMKNKDDIKNTEMKIINEFKSLAWPHMEYIPNSE